MMAQGKARQGLVNLYLPILQQKNDVLLQLVHFFTHRAGEKH